MNEDKRQIIKLLRLFSLTVLGASIATGALLLIGLKGQKESASGLLLKAIANTLFTGAIASLVFTTVASHVTGNQIDITLQTILRQVFSSIKPVIDENSITTYRWTSHLMPAPEKDTYADYGVFLIRLSYLRAVLPSLVSIVCVSSTDDKVLRPFNDRSKYLMRWQVDEGLNPEDRALFEPTLMVDGEKINNYSKQRHKVEGVPACEYRYRVPRRLRNTVQNHVDIAVVTREYLENRQIPLTTVLFSNVTDAEFILTVDKSIGVEHISVAANVSRVGPRGESSSGEIYPGAYARYAAHARFGYPLQSGGSVTFCVERAKNS